MEALLGQYKPTVHSWGPLNLWFSLVNYVFPGQDYIRDVTIVLINAKASYYKYHSGNIRFVLEDDTIINVDLYPDESATKLGNRF